MKENKSQNEIKKKIMNLMKTLVKKTKIGMYIKTFLNMGMKKKKKSFCKISLS